MPQPPAPPARPATRGRSSTVVLLGITAVAMLVFVVTVGVVGWMVSRSGGTVAEDSFLQIRLAGEIPDAPVVGGLYLDPDDAPHILTDIAMAIREAKDDERIAGLYLQLDQPVAGWAGAQELRAAIADLRAAGKPCVAYAEAYTTGSYYLASACDRVVLAPSGIGMVTGLAANITYYAGTFEKIGVKAEMLHVGDFKSAVEPYERTGPSEPAAEAMNTLLDSLWHQYVAQVAESRGKTVDEVQAWIDQPSLSPQRMLALGMVDALAYPDQVRANAHRAADAEWVTELTEPVTDDDDTIDDRFTSLDAYLKGLDAPSGGSKIAVVYAEGPIVSGEVEGGLFGSSAGIADRTFRKWMDEIREDDTIDAVVLRVNSPGGSGLASDMMWRDIERVKAAGKPVVVSMGNYAASGGYYIAAPADWIVAEPGTLTGSIGVFGGKITFQGTYEKLGLTQTTFKRGAEADLLSPTAPFDDAGRVVYQTFLDDFYEQFLSRVGTGRELARDDVHVIAQGRVWTGEQALERKLVDQLGGLDDAIAKAAELASVTDYAVARWPAQKSFVDLVLEDLESSSAPMSVSIDVPGVDAGDLTDLFVLARILDDGGVAAVLPGRLELAP
ncbi:MAG: signal peptide peptidase SppA [Myxococcota bacterium]